MSKNINKKIIYYTLNDMASKLKNARYQLGSLASWWLKEETFRQSGQAYTRPALLTGKGICHILLVRSPEMPEDSLFRKALIYPVRWEKRESHSPRIPQGLCDLADRIIHQLKEEINDSKNDRVLKALSLDRSEILSLDEWHLVPAEKDYPDLNNLNDCFTWESAWAPLTASLLLAAGNELPDPQVFGTGAWDFQGNWLKGIDGANDKMAVASEWGGKFLVLPPDPAVYTKNNNGIKPIFFPGGKETMLETVCEYCNLLRKEPPDDATFEQCEEYYVRMPTYREPQDFYLRRIKKFLVDKTKNDLYKEGNNFSFDTLVTWVSRGAEVIDVTTETFTPRKLILLYTEGFEKEMNMVKDRIGQNTKTETDSYKHEGGYGRNELKQTLDRVFSNRDDSERILVDLTLGTVSMSLMLYDVAPLETTFLYWLKEQGINNRTLPTQTRPELWVKHQNGGSTK